MAGRPSSMVGEAPAPEELHLLLRRGGLTYQAAVADGARVRFGDPLATCSAGGATLHLPAPAAGRVSLETDVPDGGRLVLRDLDLSTDPPPLERLQPQRVHRERVVETLVQAGVWPFFWSSTTGGMAPADGSEQPKSIIVTVVVAEPYRARGRVLLVNHWDRIVQGIRFLPRLLQDYGKVEIVLTHVHDPVARKLYQDLAGFAWIRFHAVPVLYPVENRRVLHQALRRKVDISREEPVWVIDAQGAEAIGACLGEGLPLHRRTVAVGGPGAVQPHHWTARVGTPLRLLLKKAELERARVLRGGVFLGTPVEEEEPAVQCEDDGFFLLPKVEAGEPLSFLRPGFDRRSYLPAFAGNLIGAADRHMNDTLRGERRPCIACGLCEKVCPVRIMPQVVHRYLYRGAYDEAERAGLERCVDCNLCTFVCPSKIELQRQFREAREMLQAERREIATAAEKTAGPAGGEE